MEDDPLMAKINTKLLENYGYTVLHIQSGNDAINTVQTNKEIDLILMDIDLGDDEILGTDLAKVILASHNIPLIFLSSHTEKEIVELTENITSYGYVVKNSSATVLDTSIKMAFRLFEAKEKAKSIEEELIKHQIELQMQIEEFLSEQEEREALNVKLFDFYHLSPIGYLTLDEKGLIKESNLTAQNMLGVQANLIDRNFHNFISEEDQDLFYLHKKKFLDSNYTNQARELRKDAPLCISIHLIYQEAMKFPIHLTLSLSHQNKENSTLRVAFMKYSKEYHQK